MANVLNFQGGRIILGTGFAGYKFALYQAGTTTPITTYKDAGLTVGNENTNPVVLDANGAAQIWFSGNAKAVFTDTNNVTVYTDDNVNISQSQSVSGQFNLILNPSFETNSSGSTSTAPDNWTSSLYTSGVFLWDSTAGNQVNGKYAAKFTSIGTGGGYLISTSQFSVTAGRQYLVSAQLKSSVANVRNVIQVNWYKYDGTVSATPNTAVYDNATTNPTTWTLEQANITAPSDADFATIQLIGCHNSNSTSGSTWFDDVRFEDGQVDGPLYFISNATGRVLPAGTIAPFAGFTLPSLWLWCDGSSVSRTTYSGLKSSITLVQTGTLTSSSAVVTGLTSTTNMSVGNPVEGTNVPVGTTIASVDSSTQVTLSATATGSGAQSLTFFPYGNGDGSTTFTVPDLRGRVPVGSGSGQFAVTAASTAVNITTDQVTVAQNNSLYNGDVVKYTTNGTQIAGLTNGNSYYVIRVSNTVIQLASTLAKAQDDYQTQVGNTSSGSATVTSLTSTANLKAGMAVSGAGITAGTTISTVDSATQITLSATATATASPTLAFSSCIDLTSQGVGNHTFTVTYSARVAGQVGGQESHAQSQLEMYAHSHGIGVNSTVSNGGSSANPSSAPNIPSNTRGGNVAMNIMQPFLVVNNYIIQT